MKEGLEEQAGAHRSSYRVEWQGVLSPAKRMTKQEPFEGQLSRICWDFKVCLEGSKRN